MPTLTILNSHPLNILKKEISKANIKGYSAMKRPALTALMMKTEYSSLFRHIKMAPPTTRRKLADESAAARAAAPKKKIGRPRKPITGKEKISRQTASKTVETPWPSTAFQIKYGKDGRFNVSLRTRKRAMSDFWSSGKVRTMYTKKQWEKSWKDWLRFDYDEDDYE